MLAITLKWLPHEKRLFAITGCKQDISSLSLTERLHKSARYWYIGSQVAERVRVDPRVTVMERTNLRYLRLSDLPHALPVDFVTLDLSFISVLAVISQICTLMTPAAGLIVLIKPQFEAAKHQVIFSAMSPDMAWF